MGRYVSAILNDSSYGTALPAVFGTPFLNYSVAKRLHPPAPITGESLINSCYVPLHIINTESFPARRRRSRLCVLALLLARFHLATDADC